MASSTATHIPANLGYSLCDVIGFFALQSLSIKSSINEFRSLIHWWSSPFVFDKQSGLLKFIFVILMRLMEGEKTYTFVYFMTLNCKLRICVESFPSVPFSWPSLTGSIARLLTTEGVYQYLPRPLASGWVWPMRAGTHNGRKRKWQEEREKSDYLFYQISSSGSPEVVSPPYQKHNFYELALSYSYFLWVLLIVSSSISFQDPGCH